MLLFIRLELIIQWLIVDIKLKQKTNIASMSKIKDQLLTELSKANTLLIVNYIGNDTEKLEELWNLTINEPSPIPERASWALNHYLEKYPLFVDFIYHKIMPHIEKFKNEPVQRNLFRILAMLETYKEEHIPALLDLAFEYMLAPAKAVAVKVHCMQVLYNISQVEIDIKQELIYAIEEEMPKNSIGFKSRGSRIIKKLQREIKHQL